MKFDTKVIVQRYIPDEVDKYDNDKFDKNHEILGQMLTLLLTNALKYYDPS